MHRVGDGCSRSGAIGLDHREFLAGDEARRLHLAFEIFRGDVGPCGRQRADHRIAFAQQLVDRARGLAFAAFGARGLCRWRPAVDIDVQPAPGVLDEALQEQRAGDRAGKAAGGRVVDVGGSSSPARNRKAATAACATADRSPASRRRATSAPASHHWCRRAVNPAPAPPAPRRSACRDRPAGPASPRPPAPAHRPAPAAPRHRCCRSRRSALARREDVERPEGVAGHRVLDRRDQHAQPHLQLRIHHHLAPAPARWRRRPCRFFMISMPLDGFRSRPPVSKQTPLPTSVTLGCDGSPQPKSIRRGARSRPCRPRGSAENSAAPGRRRRCS